MVTKKEPILLYKNVKDIGIKNSIFKIVDFLFVIEI